jgi:hypothetical protein
MVKRQPTLKQDKQGNLNFNSFSHVGMDQYLLIPFFGG